MDAVFGFFIFLAVVLYLAFCVWSGLKLNKVRAAHAQKQRARLIEAQVRQDMIDQTSYKRAAAKILRENGHTP